jgi:FkbM family methyltransferase
MNRAAELTYRVANAALIASLQKLHRAFKIPTTYKIDKSGSAALFEGAWFHYSPRQYGCTGNLDLMPEAENATRHALFERVKDGQVFYDIGAHGGVFTVTLLKRFPSLQVHSFEPQPADLLRNLALNDLPSDRVHAVAVGETPGEVRMTTKHRSSNHVSEQGDISVPLVRLDDYAAKNGLPAPDWIKIDIEGLELPALRGAELLIRGGRPTIICEINHLYGRFGTTLPDFFGYMRSLGYVPHRLTEGLQPIEGEITSLDQLGYSADFNYWFLPC